eukprot:Gb_05785 [translate_table: standard]
MASRWQKPEAVLGQEFNGCLLADRPTVFESRLDGLECISPLLVYYLCFALVLAQDPVFVKLAVLHIEVIATQSTTISQTLKWPKMNEFRPLSANRSKVW